MYQARHCSECHAELLTTYELTTSLCWECVEDYEELSKSAPEYEGECCLRCKTPLIGGQDEIGSYCSPACYQADTEAVDTV